MEESQRYETFLRSRITELRVRKDVSEHRMSLDLGKSGSYIRSITNGMSLPSLRELFNIISYFDLTPTEFFAGADAENSLRAQLHEEITRLGLLSASSVGRYSATSRSMEVSRPSAAS